jgi:hypothetical protein
MPSFAANSYRVSMPEAESMVNAVTSIHALAQ